MHNLTQKCKKAVRALTRLWAFVLISLLLGSATVQGAPFAYVTQFGSSFISVIDVKTHSVVTTIPVEGWPVDVAITPNGLLAYVTNNSDKVLVVDTKSNAVVATITVGAGPEGVAITPDGAYAYVTNYGSRTVSVIATSTASVVATIPVGGQPIGIAITPNGDFAYFTINDLGVVKVISVSTNTIVKSIPVGPAPSRIAITPDGSLAYVTLLYDRVCVIETVGNTVVKFIPVYNYPADVAITPDGKSAYVGATNFVSVIDVASTVVSTIPIPYRRAEGLAITPDGASVYATDTGNDNGGVKIIDVPTNIVSSFLETGGRTYRVAITPGDDTTPPRCAVTGSGTNALGQRFTKISCQDKGSGLASIQRTKSSNYTVKIPAFDVGTTNPVVVIATKIDNALSAWVTLKLSDVAGNVGFFDPVDVQLDRKTGKPLTFTSSGIPQAESQISISNGNPGLTTLYIAVNGTKLMVAGLRDNEVRNINVSAAMVAGDNNTISFQARGRPGGSATILIHD